MSHPIMQGCPVSKTYVLGCCYEHHPLQSFDSLVYEGPRYLPHVGAPVVSSARVMHPYLAVANNDWVHVYNTHVDISSAV